jgi:hypothetical protein
MRRGIVAAIIFVAAVNTAVLTGVSCNRSGADAVLEMTERELRLAASSRENSGVSLHIVLNREWEKPLEWFDRKKLAEVGFDLSGWNADGKDTVGMNKVLPRRVYAVLEYQGDAWKNWNERKSRELEKVVEKQASAEEGAKKRLEQERRHLEWQIACDSRLFVIDVGLDPALLRSRYSDRSRYVITPAVAQLFIRTANPPDRTKTEIYGSISEVLDDDVTVPRHLQGSLAGLAGKPQEAWSEFYVPEPGGAQVKEPRYSAIVKYGKRHEPWVESVRRLGEGK